MEDDVCWTPNHRNASHPGLISFLNFENDFPHLTTNRAHFKKLSIVKTKSAPRKQLIEEKKEEEVRKKIWEELNKPKEKLENYGKLSVYRADYPKPPGFEPTEDFASEEDIQEYDLYSDPARSIYLDMIFKMKPFITNKNLNTVFRKKSHFGHCLWSELE